MDFDYKYNSNECLGYGPLATKGYVRTQAEKDTLLNGDASAGNGIVIYASSNPSVSTLFPAVAGYTYSLRNPPVNRKVFEINTSSVVTNFRECNTYSLTFYITTDCAANANTPTATVFFANATDKAKVYNATIFANADGVVCYADSNLTTRYNAGGNIVSGTFNFDPASSRMFVSINASGVIFASAPGCG